MGNNLPAISLGGSVDVLTTGGSFACVVLTTGVRRCWGGNDFGQLGLGDHLDRGDGAGEMGASLPAVDLGEGAPAATCDGRAVTVNLTLGQHPTAGADVILGRPVADTINSLGGNDRICAGGGIDTVNAGAGADRVFGQGGNDRLTGGAGADLLDGGVGNDRLTGGTQRDTCHGRRGNDTQTGCEARTGIP
jgi:Ca2+-binding RTX toxin-like protein